MLKVVTFGTSLTARGGWQAELRQRLQACIKEDVSIHIVAMSGATSSWALSAVDQVVALNPDIVLMEFYANDAALNRMISPRESAGNIGVVLDRFHADIPKARVILMSMNPISGLRGLIRPFLSRYIDLHRRAALSRGYEFYDNGPAWDSLTEAERLEGISDGAHPDPALASKVITPGLAGVISAGCLDPVQHKPNRE